MAAEHGGSTSSKGSESKFSASDFVMFAVGALIAEPLCHAGWDAVVNGEHLERGITAIIVGSSLGSGAASFHWWKTLVSDKLRNIIEGYIGWWLAFVLILAFISFAGPDIYNRLITIATTPTAKEIAAAVIREMPTRPSSQPQDIVSLVQALRTKLDSANNTIESQGFDIKSLQLALDKASHPPAKSGPLGSAALTITVAKDRFQEKFSSNSRWLEWNSQTRGDEVSWSTVSSNINYGIGVYNYLQSTQPAVASSPDLSAVTDGNYELTKYDGKYRLFAVSNSSGLFLSFDKPVDTNKIEISSSMTLPQWHHSCSDNVICAIWFDQRPDNNTTFTIQVGQ